MTALRTPCLRFPRWAIPGAAILAAGCQSAPPTDALPPVAVAELSLALQHASPGVGSANRVIATARDASGQTIDPARYMVRWSLTDTAIAEISSSGGLLSKRVGSFTVLGEVGSVVAQLDVSVGPGAPAATEIEVSAALGRVGDEAEVRGYIVDAFGNRIREIGVYCSCFQAPGVAAYVFVDLGYRLQIVAPGQFLLSINHVDYGVPGVTRLFDIRD